MKQRDLLKILREIAKINRVDWQKVREGGNHTIFEMNGQKIIIPRHREIAERLARRIIKEGEAAAARGESP